MSGGGAYEGPMDGNVMPQLENGDLVEVAEWGDKLLRISIPGRPTQRADERREKKIAMGVVFSVGSWNRVQPRRKLCSGESKKCKKRFPLSQKKRAAGPKPINRVGSKEIS